EYEDIAEKDAEFYSMKSIILIMQNNLEKAEKILNKGLEYYSNNFDLKFNLAFVYENMGYYQKAVELYLDSKSLAESEGEKKDVAQALEKLDEEIEGDIGQKNNLVFFIKKGLDKFIDDLIEGLSIEYNTKKIIVEEYSQIDKWMEWADIVWFEWCDELVIYGSKQKIAKDKKIICRLHSYEAFTDYIKKVKWDNIDKVIFVAEHIKKAVSEEIDDKIEDKSVIIPNEIDIDKFKFKKRNPGYNLAYVGLVNFKKGPMLLLQVIKALVKKDSRYKLYIAGKFEQKRYVLYFKQMLKDMSLQNNVIFEGWKENIDQWLEDTNYIISTSLLESQHLAIMEAMSKGIKPIIHNFVGAKEIYPGKYIWNSIDDAVKLISEEEYHSEQYYKFIKENYNRGKYIKEIKKLCDNLLKNKNGVNQKINSNFQIKKNENRDKFIVTGIPKSGTTLLSALISSIPNTMCLDEIIYDIDNLPEKLNKVKKRLINNEPIPNSFKENGELSTNKRREAREKIWKRVQGEYNKHTMIGLKVNTPYLLNLNKIIKNRFKIIAVIRNPIYTIASWRSWEPNTFLDSLPENDKRIAEARVKKGDVSKRFKNFSFKSDKTVERQAEIWNYLASIVIKNKDNIKIYKYEDLTEKTDLVMKDISNYLGVNFSYDNEKNIDNMNIDKRYSDLEKIKKAVKKYSPNRKDFGY
ncbi:MAG: glycosyltransferase, partial [Candidatus Woesearchaeota archaeon]